MNGWGVSRRISSGLLIGIVLLLAGCPGRDKSSGGGGRSAAGRTKFEGTYQSAQDPAMSIEIKPDHKAVLTDKDGPNEVTWEQPSDDKLIIHGELAQVELYRNSDGSLRDNMSSDWKKK
jgi:hypothetical protein